MEGVIKKTRIKDLFNPCNKACGCVRENSVNKNDREYSIVCLMSRYWVKTSVNIVVQFIPLVTQYESKSFRV